MSGSGGSGSQGIDIRDSYCPSPPHWETETTARHTVRRLLLLQAQEGQDYITHNKTHNYST